MSWAVDTNVLLRMTDVGHTAQPIAEHALKLLGQRESLRLFPQTLIEFWALATRARVDNGLALTIADAEIQLGRLKRMFVLLDDTPEVFSAWEGIVSRYQVIGKQSHDAHLVAAMLAHGVTHLLSFNDRDFKRYREITVVNPQDVVQE